MTDTGRAPLPRLGVGLIGHGLEMPEIIAIGQACEAAGFDSIWVGEYFHNAFTLAAAVGATTETIGLGTGVALAFPRSPLLTALAALDLAEVSRGRFVLGIGSQVKRAVERWHGLAYEHPTERMLEYSTAVRTALGHLTSNGDGRYAGSHYHLDLHDFAVEARRIAPPPVWVAAAGPRMTEVAVRGADGVIGHLFWSVRHIREQVQPLVAERSDPFTVAASILCSVNGDADLARKDAKRTLGFYAATRTYLPLLEADGFASEARAARHALRDGDHGALEAAVSQEMLETYAVAGTPRDALEQLKARANLLDTVLLTVPHAEVPLGRVRDQYDGLAELAYLARPATAPVEEPHTS